MGSRDRPGAAAVSAPTLSEWFAELVDVQRDLESMGQDDSVYGSCCVGDPRNVHPDPECSTEEERALWKADCERAERELSRETKTSCSVVDLGEGRVAMVMPRGDADARDFAERLQRVIGQIEMWREEHLTDEEKDT